MLTKQAFCWQISVRIHTQGDSSEPICLEFLMKPARCVSVQHLVRLHLTQLSFFFGSRRESFDITRTIFARVLSNLFRKVEDSAYSLLLFQIFLETTSRMLYKHRVPGTATFSRVKNYTVSIKSTERSTFFEIQHQLASDVVTVRLRGGNQIISKTF